MDSARAVAWLTAVGPGPCGGPCSGHCAAQVRGLGWGPGLCGAVWMLDGRGADHGPAGDVGAGGPEWHSAGQAAVAPLRRERKMVFA